MPKNSPPKHRHDGSSPLPLGMDWSPPPKRWEGRNTIWPHNPQTGWSYCVNIPSWIVQTEPGASQESFLNPTVFYRIHVGLQSPEGVSSSHGLLRRFSDFLKLYSALKKTFSRKDIPPAPPKHAFLKISSSRMLLEERRQALEEWMGKLLSDLDLSRSAPVAGFLELEAAARSFHSTSGDVNHPRVQTSSVLNGAADPSILARPSSTASVADSSRVVFQSYSVVPYVDNAHEESELESPKQGGKPQLSKTSTESSIHSHSSNFYWCNCHCVSGQSVFEQSEVSLTNSLGESSSKDDTFRSTSSDSKSNQNHDKHYGHTRKPSSESIASDTSSIRGSDLSITGAMNLVWDSSVDVPRGADFSSPIDSSASFETEVPDDEQMFLPLDQRHKLNRLLITLQRRLTTAKTDMEDLIARLNQEMAVKEYLTTKVKDLEVELEATKQKAKDNLQQAILIERERVTQMQWDMDELRRKCAEMESKLKVEQNEKTRAESAKTTATDEKELLLQELNNKQDELQNTRKHLEEVELKSKADLKVLIKEVKSLRNSQAELKKSINQTLKEKAELEGVIHNERQRGAHGKLSNAKFLRECKILQDRLKQCSVNLLEERDDKLIVSHSSLSDALDLIETSDNRIALLLAEAQLLTREDEHSVIGLDEDQRDEFSQSNVSNTDDDIRNVLGDVLIDNARLRKQVNAVTRYALSTVMKPEKENNEDTPTRKTVLSRFLER